MYLKISVIIATYKRPQLLLKCLAALQHQSFLNDDYEVIIVTDGPDENTDTAVKLFNTKNALKNLVFTSISAKKGPAAARNKGASMARGELLVFTDDDCIPCTQWLYQFWKKYLLYCFSSVALSGKTIVPKPNRPTDYAKNVGHLETAEFITANCACTRNIFRKVNGFDENFPIAWREDSDLHFKFISSFVPIIKTTKAIVIHPVRSAPWGISLQEQKKCFYNALLYKKYPELYRKKIGSMPLWNYYTMVLFFFISVISFFQHHIIISFPALICWLLLVIQFMIKRLKGTSKKISHLLEMAVTSATIPFLSIFWTMRGSLYYKKFLL